MPDRKGKTRNRDFLLEGSAVLGIRPEK